MLIHCVRNTCAAALIPPLRYQGNEYAYAQTCIHTKAHTLTHTHTYTQPPHLQQSVWLDVVLYQPQDAHDLWHPQLVVLC